ncbi:hypothetical protein CPC08DRAFT_713486 [Agrocybe pediades]|nr:hypothetical protein CPC08DRAFT_713486 [Agrocybe pediades]
MGSVQVNISLITSSICCYILQLGLDDRQILTALLKWDPSASDRLTRALQSVDLPWQKLSFEEEYSLILHDLESVIQQTPLLWAEVATVNIRLDSLSARISQVSPGSVSLMGHVRDRSSTGTSLFHNAQQIMIMGGSFTVHSQITPQNIAPASSPQPLLLDERTPTEIGAENPFCPIRRLFVCVKYVIMLIAHKVDGAVRRRC